MLQRVCEEKGALFLFFDWRSSLTTPIEDCTRLYVFMQRFNWQSSLRVYHSNTTTFCWCGAEASRADEVGQLACPPEFVQIQENPVLLWVSQTMPGFFLSQVFMPEFSLQVFMPEIFFSQVFITGATVNLTQDDVVLNSVVKSECDRTLKEKARRRVNCLPWLDSFLLRQTELSSRSCTRPNMFALQTSLEKALYTTGVSDASDIPTDTRKFIRLRKLTDKSTSLWPVHAHTLGTRRCRIYFVLLNMVSDGTEFWFTSETRFCAYHVCVLPRYSAEQSHVSQPRGDTSDLVKEFTIFHTSSAGSWRRVWR